MTATEAFPLPRRDHVRFYLVTGDGVLTAEAVREELGEGRHEPSPLFDEAHDLITAVREHAPEQPAAPRYNRHGGRRVGARAWRRCTIDSTDPADRQ